MANRTQIVCLCEGEKGKSVDPVFVNRLLKSLRPSWVRPWQGSNFVRIIPCGSRSDVIARMPDEMQVCNQMGGRTTLMVWADCDNDCSDGDALKLNFWQEAERRGVARNKFDEVVFIFPKDRLENWIEFLNSGTTDESNEGPRVRNSRQAADAAKRLAQMCESKGTPAELPRSLQWSCRNWHAFAQRMKSL